MGRSTPEASAFVGAVIGSKAMTSSASGAKTWAYG